MNFEEIIEWCAIRMLQEQIDPKDQFIIADGWEGLDPTPFRTGSVSVAVVQDEDGKQDELSWENE